jgi:hypothetical protein
MKKTALAALIISAIGFESDAMKPTSIFRCLTKPPVTLARQQDQKICLDGLITAQSIDLQAKFYNDIPLKAPLQVKANMTDEDIVAALVRTFGCRVTITTAKR